MLDLRLQAEYAIHTAVDYGVQNMKALTDAGFKLDSLNDGEKAKIVYLCHHLGSGDAKKFINNTITAEHAQYLLENQVGKAGAAAKAKASGGDYLLAHRTWLKDFIDKRITLPDHMCDASKAETTRDLIPVTEAVRPAK